MVAARADLLAEGHFAHLGEALADIAAAAVGLVVDNGAGTGYYLAAVLDRSPDSYGLALDVSKAAARRAARAHPRAAAAVCDIWQGLPVADGSAAVVLDVFAPRNAAEFHRVLRPDGLLLVVTPQPDHLAELVGQLGLIGVDPDKDRRLGSTFDQRFRLVDELPLRRQLSLSHDSAARFVAMGPSAWHTDARQLSERLSSLPEPVLTTLSVTVRTYRPQPPQRPVERSEA
jgi:SAM-dependent methyltransferase